MPTLPLFLVLGLAALLWSGCGSTPATADVAPPPTPVPAFAFEPASLKKIDELIEQGMADHRLPGAVVWIERDGVSYHKAYGRRAVAPAAEPMTEETIFDAASLTKVMATTPAVMRLVERSEVDLEAPVSKYIPEFRRDGKAGITVRHLLTHTSGLRAGLGRAVDGQRSAVAFACQEKVTNAPGTSFTYSDINFILLGEIVQRVSLEPLEQFVSREIFRPLKMRDTRYLPLGSDHKRIAPTTRTGTNTYLRGEVHDPTARGMGGVAGHAGIFTTAADTARFCRMMLNGGELDGVRLFQPETVSLMTGVQTSPLLKARRGLGWDIDTGFSRRGEVFPVGSYGHTGFTGTALWIDPFSKTFWVLMSNRVHPDGSGNILALQKAFSTLAAEAARLPKPAPAPESPAPVTTP